MPISETDTVLRSNIFDSAHTAFIIFSRYEAQQYWSAMDTFQRPYGNKIAKDANSGMTMCVDGVRMSRKNTLIYIKKQGNAPLKNKPSSVCRMLSFTFSCFSSISQKA